jgi:hypothetical protein
MAQLTLDIPDELAQRLAPFQSQLSELFARLIATTLPDESSEPSTSVGLLPINSPDLPPTYLEVLDFLVTRPTSQQLLKFKVSEPSQIRLQVLLEKSREASLSASEKTELSLYEQLDGLMTLLKIRTAASATVSDDAHSV